MTDETISEPTAAATTFSVVAYPARSEDASKDGKTWNGLQKDEAERLAAELNDSGWIVIGVDPE